MTDSLQRRLGLTASVAVGMSAMIGAGLFVVFGPAVEAAGDGLVIALVIATVIATCNAVSSARLARLYPLSGGTYVYGRERLGPFWGHLAGWSFIVGKLASCAVMALAIGRYLWPEQAQAVAVLVVATVTVLNLAGVERSARAGIVIVAVVLVVVVAAIAALATGPAAAVDPTVQTSPGGVLQAAGLLFFAFAGYARLATLGEEVRRPEVTIPAAIAIAMVLTVLVYVAAAAALLHTLGPVELAASTRPFVDGLEAVGAGGLAPVVAATATLAAGGALLSLTLGVSRTTLAMARDRHLPGQLALIDSRRAAPWVAEIVVGAVVAAWVVVGDLATGVAVSSFCVLTYYAIANTSALTLRSSALGSVTAGLGLVGCGLLAAALPTGAAISGALVVLSGAASYLVRRHRTGPAKPIA